MEGIRQSLQSSAQLEEGSARNSATQLLPDPRSPSEQAAALRVASLLSQQTEAVDKGASSSLPPDISRSMETMETCSGALIGHNPASSSGTEAPDHDSSESEEILAAFDAVDVRQGSGSGALPKQAPSGCFAGTGGGHDRGASDVDVGGDWMDAQSGRDECELVARLFEAGDCHVAGAEERAGAEGCGRKAQKQRQPWSIKVRRVVG